MSTTNERDGLGDAIVSDADYYVQDNRSFVGNDVVWWGCDSKGYVCEIDKAGVYKGAKVVGMRDTDVPWPVALVLANVVRHVRIEPLHRAAEARKEERQRPPPHASPPKAAHRMRRASDGTLHRVVELDGVEGYEVRWTEECTGCTEREGGQIVSGPMGCNECGYTCKRRRVEWVPFDLAEARTLFDAAGEAEAGGEAADAQAVP